MFSTAYLIFFVILVVADYPDTAAVLFMLSPLLVIWLVYIVLRYGEASGRTFDEYYYDDVNIRVDKLRKYIYTVRTYFTSIPSIASKAGTTRFSSVLRTSTLKVHSISNICSVTSSSYVFSTRLTSLVAS